MKVKLLGLVATLLLALALMAAPLGFFEVTFSTISFDAGKWERNANNPACLVYVAKEDNAEVAVIPQRRTFKAKKGLKVIACGSTAAFDEGFEDITPDPQ